MTLSPDELEVPNDDAPEVDPDPAPAPIDAGLDDHEARIVREGFTLGEGDDAVDVTFAPNEPQKVTVDDGA